MIKVQNHLLTTMFVEKLLPLPGLLITTNITKHHTFHPEVEVYIIKTEILNVTSITSSSFVHFCSYIENFPGVEIFRSTLQFN